MKRTFFFSFSEPPEWLRDMELLRGFGREALPPFGSFSALSEPLLPFLGVDEGEDGRSFGGTGGDVIDAEGECCGMLGRPLLGPSTPGVAIVDHVPESPSGISTDGGALARRPGEPSGAEGTEGRTASSVGAEGMAGRSDSGTRGSSGTAGVSFYVPCSFFLAQPAGRS